MAVVDDALPAGLAANAVGMLAITLGAELPALVGPALVDADGHRHHGFVPQGLPVLAAPASSLGAMRTEAIAADVGVIGFPAAGQQTTDYDAFRQHFARTAGADLVYLGVLLYGPRRAVNRLTGRLPLLR